MAGDFLSSARKRFLSSSVAAALEKNHYTDLSRTGLDVLKLSAVQGAALEADGCEVLPLSDARAAPLLEKLLAQPMSASSAKYFELAKATAAGSLVVVPAGATATIRLSYPASSDGAKLSTFFTLYSIGVGAAVRVLEENRLNSSHVVSSEVFLGENAVLHYSTLLASAPAAISLSQRRFFAGPGASVTSLTAVFGASLCKSLSEAVLEGAGSSSRDNSLAFASGTQHFDLASNLHHRAVLTKGSSVMRAVLRDSGRAVFWGNIRIDKGAKHADAYLSQNALLLNPGARADAMPTLEIEEADVRATHSSSVTHADDDSLFYLASRGIPKPEAKKTLASSFLESVAERAGVAQALAPIEAEIARKWLA
jgi:Fe-S cluster assembly scaffold protein SufB